MQKRVRDESLIRGRHRTGQYIIAGNEPCAENIRDWITRRGFEQYERAALRLKRDSKPRNKLYNFHLPEAKCTVVMKTSTPVPEYKLPRRLELALKHVLNDYNKTAFLMCRRMRLAGIPVTRPFAYWNSRRGLLDQVSYFLYEKFDPDCSLAEWYETIRQSGHDNTDELLKAAIAKAMAIVRAMHDAGFRHSDPHGGNFLVRPATRPETAAGAGAPDVERTVYCLVDYDQCSRAAIRLPPIKQFFDLRELRRTSIGGLGPHQLLNVYLDGKPSPCAHAVLEFWHRGGFNPWRWLFPQREKIHGRHLKRPPEKPGTDQTIPR